MNPGAGLHGSSPFESAKIYDWIAWCHQQWTPTSSGSIMAILGHKKVEPAQFKKRLADIKALAKYVDSELKGKQWLVGKSFSAADLVVGTSF